MMFVGKDNNKTSDRATMLLEMVDVVRVFPGHVIPGRDFIAYAGTN